MYALQISLRMRKLERRRISLRGFLAFEFIEDVCLENLVDCPQPVGSLGMAGRVDMFEADGMGIEECGQGEIRGWPAITSAMNGCVKDRSVGCIGLLVDKIDGAIFQSDNKSLWPVGLDADCLVDG